MNAFVQRTLDSFLHPSLIAAVENRIKSRILVVFIVFFSVIAALIGNSRGFQEGYAAAPLIGI